MITKSKTKKASSNKPSSRSPKLSKNTPSNKVTVTPFVRRFLKRVQNTVAKYQLWGSKESFIIAVSGGPDSLCLLDILFLLSQKYSFKLHIAHVNYRLRCADSDRDEVLVRERAEHYGLTLSVLRPKKTSAANLEEKLRDIRYQFFEKLRRQKKATLIAVAHHQDDQAETFLLRLLRGSGMQGLSAMRPKNSFVIRPLIAENRADILRYLTERHITARVDSSNTDPKFFRNRVRNQLIPLIEKKYQPQIKKILANTATLLASDYTMLEALPSSVSTRHSDVLQYSVTTLLTLPEPLLKRELRTILKPHFRGKSPPQGLIDETMKLLRSTKNKHQEITRRGLKMERKGDTVRLFRFQS